MKIAKSSLIKYLYDNVSMENSLLHTDGSVSVRLSGFNFMINDMYIIYEKHGVSDNFKVVNSDLDDFFDKVYKFYSVDDLNSELKELIRNNNIDKIS